MKISNKIMVIRPENVKSTPSKNLLEQERYFISEIQIKATLSI